MAEYDPRYLAGILFFNDEDYFEAHEVWEDLWAESYGDDRRFVQGLIQAAVGLFHFGGGNLGGAVKLYRTSREYMRPCGSPFWGLDTDEFWTQMERCFHPLLDTAQPDRSLRPEAALLPKIALDPPPGTWPNASEFVADEDE
jgi:predicted metal-dependent hydrolase